MRAVLALRAPPAWMVSTASFASVRRTICMLPIVALISMSVPATLVKVDQPARTESMGTCVFVCRGTQVCSVMRR